MSKNDNVIKTKDWPFEEEYKAVLQKPAPKEDFVRILYAADLVKILVKLNPLGVVKALNERKHW